MKTGRDAALETRRIAAFIHDALRNDWFFNTGAGQLPRVHAQVARLRALRRRTLMERRILRALLAVIVQATEAALD